MGCAGSAFSINDFFIICVDSALKPLLEYKINPDIVVAVESQLANEKAFRKNRFLCCRYGGLYSPARRRQYVG